MNVDTAGSIPAVPAKIDAEHVKAIIAVLNVLVIPVMERYPDDTVRQAAYAALVLEDAAVACRLAVITGVEFEQVAKLIAESAGELQMRVGIVGHKAAKFTPETE